MCISCNAQNNDNQDKYRILSLITNHLTKIKKTVPYPPKPNNLYSEKVTNKSLSHQDSINMEKSHQKKIDKKYTIAIDLVQKPFVGNKKSILPDTCQEFSILYEAFLNSKKKEEIKIECIDLQRNDSLVYFKNEFSNNNIKDYISIDKRLNFSKAIIQVSYTTSKLDGISLIYFLEKIKGNWQIICEKGISIS